MIDKEKKEKVEKLARDYGLGLVLLFGSAVSGRTHQGSDIDIAVLFGDLGTARARVIDLSVDLQEIFSDRETDLALIDGAYPPLSKKDTREL